MFKKCSYIFNFAGIADIDESLRNPEKTITNNILNNFKLLEITKKHNIKKYILQAQYMQVVTQETIIVLARIAVKIT